METNMPGRTREGCIDTSQVTPATGTDPNNKPIPETLANEMPTSDFPGNTSLRTDPDKIIPGPEAATAVDQLESDQTVANDKPKNSSER